MRKTKIVYSFDDKGVYAGVETAWESWDLDGTFLLPANTTETKVPTFDPVIERALWSEETNSWAVEQITQENTPKPYYNAELFDVEWSVNRWEIKQNPLPSQENTPKPEYDSEKFFLEWDLNHWAIKEIPTPENTPKPEYDSSTHNLEWFGTQWGVIEKPSWGTIRDERNQLLTQSDWTQLADAPLTQEQKTAWSAYRQALRDVPSSFSTPEEVVWPAIP